MAAKEDLAQRVAGQRAALESEAPRECYSNTHEKCPTLFFTEYSYFTETNFRSFGFHPPELEHSAIVGACRLSRRSSDYL